MMNYKNLILSILFVLVGQVLLAQTIVVKGRVINSKTKEPIVYANIGIEGTLTGGASNINGYFEFKIKTTDNGEVLYASAVGYETIKKSLSTITANQEVILEMVPKTMSLEGVDVSAQSLILYQRLRNAAAKISENYLSSPFITKSYYQSSTTVNRVLKRDRKAAVDVYDATGYQKESKADVFNHVNYAFKEVKKSFDVTSLKDGMTMMNELLEFDIVRYPGNILSTEFVRNFDLELEEETVYEGENVWVIAYKLQKPNSTTTGDYYATSYEGKVYITENNYAVVKNETWVKASNYNPQGRSIVLKPSRSQKFTAIDYHFTTIYRKVAGKYMLAMIRSERNHKYGSKMVNIKSDLLTTELVMENIKPIEGRDFFTDKPYNASFWNSYNFILE